MVKTMITIPKNPGIVLGVFYMPNMKYSLFSGLGKARVRIVTILAILPRFWQYSILPRCFNTVGNITITNNVNT